MEKDRDKVQDISSERVEKYYGMREDEELPRDLYFSVTYTFDPKYLSHEEKQSWLKMIFGGCCSDISFTLSPQCRRDDPDDASGHKYRVIHHPSDWYYVMIPFADNNGNKEKAIGILSEEYNDKQEITNYTFKQFRWFCGDMTVYEDLFAFLDCLTEASDKPAYMRGMGRSIIMWPQRKS